MSTCVGKLPIRKALSSTQAIDYSEDGEMAVATESLVYIVKDNVALVEKQTTATNLPVTVKRIPLPERPYRLYGDDSKHAIKGKNALILGDDLDNAVNGAINLVPDTKQSPGGTASQNVLPRAAALWRGKTWDKLTSGERVEAVGELIGGIRQVSWSPMGLGYHRKCVLAVLYWDYHLIIYHEDHDNWNMLCDVSDLWADFLRRNPSACGSLIEEGSKDNIDKIKEVCFARAAVAISWSPAFLTSDGSTVSFLSVALRAPYVVLVRVSATTAHTRDFDVVSVFRSDAADVSYLYFLPVISVRQQQQKFVYLCETSNSGTVSVHTLKLSLRHSSEPLTADGGEASGGQTLSLMTTTPLWTDEDKLSVAQLLWVPQKRLLIGAKAQFIIMWKLLHINDDEDEGETACAGPVCPTTSVHLLPLTLHISSILWLEDRLIISSVDSLVFKASCDTSPAEPQLVNVEPIVDVPWEKRAWACHGLVSSVNGVYLIAVLRPSVHYNIHTRPHVPADIVWFRTPIVTREAADVLLTKPVDDFILGWIASKKDALSHTFVLQSQTRSISAPLQSLVDELSNDKVKQASTHHLVLVRYLLRLKLISMIKLKVFYEEQPRISCEEEKFGVKMEKDYQQRGLSEELREEQERVELELRVGYIEEELMRRHIVESLNRFLTSAQDKSHVAASVCGRDGDVLRVMCALLKLHSTFPEDKHLADKVDSVRVGNTPVKKEANKNGNTASDYWTETCIICRADVKVQRFDRDMCNNGHTFRRCCQTLLLCQSVPYRTCTICYSQSLHTQSEKSFSSAALKSGDTESLNPFLDSLQTSYCAYCGSIML